MSGLIRLHEPEERFEVLLSVANQAVAFERISRSSFSRRFSRRSLLSSSRSALVSPPSPLPASRASCLTHKEIDQGVGPNSFAKDAGVRPERTKSTICRLNSGVYRTALFAIVDASKTNHEVSTKPGQVQFGHAATQHVPWNKGKLVGQKAPLKLKDIWAIRVRLQIGKRTRELALFNLAIDSKLRSCDLVKLRVSDVCHGTVIAAHAMVMQQKIQRPVQFEITEQTRDSLLAWIREAARRSDDYLFRATSTDRPTCLRGSAIRPVGGNV
jgi:hypothetical protein